MGDNVVQTRLLEGARAHVKNVVNLLRVQKLEQVLLQVRVSEVDRSMAKELGFNFLFEGNTLRGIVSPATLRPLLREPADQDLGNVGPNSTFSDAMNLFVAKPGSFPDFGVFLRALHDKGGLKTLAEPNIVVANGSVGHFLVGGSSPSSSTRGPGEAPLPPLSTRSSASS